MSGADEGWGATTARPAPALLSAPASLPCVPCRLWGDPHRRLVSGTSRPLLCLAPPLACAAGAFSCKHPPRPPPLHTCSCGKYAMGSPYPIDNCVVSERWCQTSRPQVAPPGQPSLQWVHHALQSLRPPLRPCLPASRQASENNCPGTVGTLPNCTGPNYVFGGGPGTIMSEQEHRGLPRVLGACSTPAPRPLCPAVGLQAPTPMRSRAVPFPPCRLLRRARARVYQERGLDVWGEEGVQSCGRPAGAERRAAPLSRPACCR